MVPSISFQIFFVQASKIVGKLGKKCHSKTEARFMHIVLLKCRHVQVACLKFISCYNQALVGCMPIPAVAVHLILKL